MALLPLLVISVHVCKDVLTDVLIESGTIMNNNCEKYCGIGQYLT